MARDDYAPHLFKRLGDRLAHSNGILVLGGLAIVLLVVCRGRTDSLIPLYTIGVFLAFTMSQAGMVARWLRLREPGWQRGLAVNAVGMTLTATVFVITAWEKFLTGAWVVMVIIPLLVLTFRAIHRHDTDVVARLKAKWEAWGSHVPLEVIESPYRLRRYQHQRRRLRARHDGGDAL
jgi:peptidoglycan/LPS O-acetylase OafA/YrhL